MSSSSSPSKQKKETKEEEAVLKSLSSLDAFIDEVHTSLISLDLNEPPLFFAFKALQRRSQKADEDIGPTHLPIPKQMIMEFGVGAGHTLKKIKEFFPGWENHRRFRFFRRPSGKLDTWVLGQRGVLSGRGDSKRYSWRKRVHRERFIQRHRSEIF